MFLNFTPLILIVVCPMWVFTFSLSLPGASFLTVVVCYHSDGTRSVSMEGDLK